jgi:adenylate kinase
MSARVVLLGPPGAGKGTQARVVAQELGVPHISTGDMLRASAGAGTPVGRQAQGFMNAGLLVPDEIVVGAVAERLAQPDAARGFVFDGFPRNVHQADALSALLGGAGVGLDRVINIDVPAEDLVERISGRRVCRGCTANYHLRHSAPREAGRCDACGGKLFQRPDDTEGTVRERLAVYIAQTKPLIEYYGRGGLLRTVDGREDIGKVTASIMDALRGNG